MKTNSNKINMAFKHMKNGSSETDLYSFDLDLSNIEFESNTTIIIPTRLTTSNTKITHVDEPIYLSVIKGTIM
jgi:hypothetical protein